MRPQLLTVIRGHYYMMRLLYDATVIRGHCYMMRLLYEVTM